MKIIAKQLDRILALHAGNGFRHVVLEILREVEFHAREFSLEPGEHFVGQAILVDLGTPFACGFEWHEKLRIKEAGGIGTVIRPSVLGNDGFHLRKISDNSSHSIDIGVAFLQRDRRWQRGSNPEIAFFEFWQKLQTE